MSYISIRFTFNAWDIEDVETVIDDINPDEITVKELFRKFCEKSSTLFCTDNDKISFLFNGKLINEKSFLDLYLSDKKIRLISTKHTILVKDLSHLIGQNINKIYNYFN